MNNKKISIIFILIAISVLGLIGLTLALYNRTEVFDNLFTSAIYQTKVTEVFTSPDNWKPGDITPKTVTVKNNGNVPVSVRIKINESWASEDGTPLPLRQDGEKVAIINLDNTEDWTRDGAYYFYNETLEPNEQTSSFLESVTFNQNITNDYNCVQTGNSMSCDNTSNSYDGGKYTLTFQIETIQEDFAETQWDLDDGTLYGIVKSEYDSNSGYGGLYTGEHGDSFERDASKKIYYYKAASGGAAQGNILLDKTNVIFGGYCWQILRTTDTGGVKMIYNGIPVDGECTKPRDNINGVNQGARTTVDMNGTYIYGNDYTYDVDNGTYKITGTTKSANYVNDKSVIGMYTCKSSDVNSTCSTMYYIHEINTANANKPYVYPYTIGSINYATIGATPYNSQQSSMAYVGYMYNKVYERTTTSGTSNSNYANLNRTILTSKDISTTYWYSDSIDYGNNVPNKYTLINPYQISSSSDYPNLVGKYTFLSTSQSSDSDSIYYIAGVNGNTMFCKQMTGGNLIDDYKIVFGTSISPNGSYYDIDNYTSVSLNNYYANYSSYQLMYTCENNSITCSSPIFITVTRNNGYTYISDAPTNTLLIAKSKNGLELSDTLLVRKSDLSQNPSNYSNYIYTCNSDSNICTDSTIRKIKSFTNDYYEYYPNIFLAKSANWDGEKYILNEVLTDIDMTTDIDNYTLYHYFCPSRTTIECATVGYIYNYSGSGAINYVELSDSVETIDSAINEMLYDNNVNVKESAIKRFVEEWYSHNLINYDEYLEETIYCNDRNIATLGGWDDKNPPSSNLVFKEFSSPADLSCVNITDSFSVLNNKARLKYKIGLASASELKLINNNSYRGISGLFYFTLSADYNAVSYYVTKLVYSGGDMNAPGYFISTAGARPVISLVPNIVPTSGSGTMTNPYVIDVEPAT